MQTFRAGLGVGLAGWGGQVVGWVGRSVTDQTNRCESHRGQGLPHERPDIPLIQTVGAWEDREKLEGDDPVKIREPIHILF